MDVRQLLETGSEGSGVYLVYSQKMYTADRLVRQPPQLSNGVLIILKIKRYHAMRVQKITKVQYSLRPLP